MKPYPPLGILYLSSHLRARGFTVDVFDTTFASFASFRTLLKLKSPSLVGIYGNLTTRGNTLRLIRLCKEQGCTVILGGPEPAGYAQEYLQRGADVVVSGEGELTLEELIAHLARQGPERMHSIPGIVWRDGDGNLVRNPPRPFIQNLDAQPFPDREAIDVDRYLRVWRRQHGRGSVSLITSRGCPYTCTWCSHGVFGYSYRARSAVNVADEVEQILQTYRPDMLWYADDVFTLNPRWVVSYADELKRRDLKVPFETISREDRLDEEIVQVLAAMGCHRLWIGSESGSQRVLDAMQRRTDPDRVRHIIGLLSRYGIQSGIFIMLGYEGETEQDIKKTAALLKESQPDVFLTTLAYPIKGTPYYDEVKDRIISLRPWEQGSDRDLTVRGRHSRQFYRYANRWLVGKVGCQRLHSTRPRKVLEMARFLTQATIGRLGMLATRSERE